MIWRVALAGVVSLALHVLGFAAFVAPDDDVQTTLQAQARSLVGRDDNSTTTKASSEVASSETSEEDSDDTTTAEQDEEEEEETPQEEQKLGH